MSLKKTICYDSKTKKTVDKLINVIKQLLAGKFARIFNYAIFFNARKKNRF